MCLRQDHGISQIRFQDDNMGTGSAANDARLRSICQDLNSLNFLWRCSYRIDKITRASLDLMAASGCQEIGYGIESGDPDVLLALKKRINLPDAIERIRWTQAAGIKVRLFLMTGTPGETELTTARNIEFIEAAQPEIVTVSLFHPFPGSDIWDQPSKYGIKRIKTKDPERYVMNLSPVQDAVPSIILEGLSDEKMTESVNAMRSHIFTRGIGNRGL